MPEWVIRTADNVFLRDKGGEGLAAGESVVTVSEVPSLRFSRYDATVAGGIRAATAQEMTALLAEEKDARATVDHTANLMMRAVAQLDFEERQKLQVTAGQTLRTAQECLARVKAIYRNLL